MRARLERWLQLCFIHRKNWEMGNSVSKEKQGKRLNLLSASGCLIDLVGETSHLQMKYHFQSSLEESAISQNLPKYSQDLLPKRDTYTNQNSYQWQTFSLHEHLYSKHHITKNIKFVTITLNACMSDKSWEHPAPMLNHKKDNNPNLSRKLDI